MSDEKIEIVLINHTSESIDITEIPPVKLPPGIGVVIKKEQGKEEYHFYYDYELGTLSD